MADAARIKHGGGIYVSNPINGPLREQAQHRFSFAGRDQCSVVAAMLLTPIAASSPQVRDRNEPPELGLSALMEHDGAVLVLSAVISDQ